MNLTNILYKIEKHISIIFILGILIIILLFAKIPSCLVERCSIIIGAIFTFVLTIAIILQLIILRREEEKSNKKLEFKYFRTTVNGKIIYEITVFNTSTEANAIYNINVFCHNEKVDFNFANVDFFVKEISGPRSSYMSLPYKKQYLFLEKPSNIRPLSVPKSEAVNFALFFDTDVIIKLQYDQLNEKQKENPILNVKIEDFRGNSYPINIEIQN